MRYFAAILAMLPLLASGQAGAQDVATESPPDLGADAVAQMPPTPPPAAPSAEPRLLVTVNVAGAQVIVDDAPAVAAPARAVVTSVGPHTVRVEAEGYEPFSQRVEVPVVGARIDAFLEPSAALAERFAATDEHAPSSRSERVTQKWWFWAALGGGVIIIGAVIAAVALAGGGNDSGQTAIPVPPIPGGP